MSFLDALLLESYRMDWWIALRGDNQQGSGTADDPFNGGLAFGSKVSISLSRIDYEGKGDTGGQPHGFIEGDIVEISGVLGQDNAQL